MRKIISSVLLAVLFLISVLLANAQNLSVTVIKAGKMIDTVSGKVFENVEFVMKGGEVYKNSITK